MLKVHVLLCGNPKIEILMHEGFELLCLVVSYLREVVNCFSDS